MATQVQIRRASQATQEGRTLVSGELDFNTTDNRLAIHNGSRAGGIRHVNMFDQQNSEFNYASTSGTNAIAAAMRIAPSSYVAGQVFWLKVSNTTTGSATLNINSLGAKTIKKVFNGAFSNLSAGDFISGQTVGVIYDGTNFQVISGSGGQAGKQSFTPTMSGSTSNTLKEAFYVDYGDAVTVCVEYSSVSKNLSSNLSVSNLPFSPETGLAGVTHIGSGNTVPYYINDASTTMNVLSDGTIMTGSILEFNITYIKN